MAMRSKEELAEALQGRANLEEAKAKAKDRGRIFETSRLMREAAEALAAEGSEAQARKPSSERLIDELRDLMEILTGEDRRGLQGPRELPFGDPFYEPPTSDHPLVQDWLALGSAEFEARGGDMFSATERQRLVSKHLYWLMIEVGAQIIRDPYALAAARKAEALPDLALRLATLKDGTAFADWRQELERLWLRRQELYEALLADDVETALRLSWARPDEAG